MAELTLGLDVGPNSIGWGLVDQGAGKIVAAGVRVFPEGVDRDQKGGEKSKSQSRRDARGMRRQIRRRAQRRRLLRQALTAAGLLPDDSERFKSLLERNPYELRSRALDEQLQPHEIGRALLHLGQRRGFLSNRKTDKPNDNKTKGILAEMSELAAEMEQAGSRTLGEHFAERATGFHPCTQPDGPHIRRRHTRRAMYEAEFERIWSAQQKHYPQLLTELLKFGKRGKQSFPKRPERLGKHSNLVDEFGLYGLIFFQRKMYWPKSVVGRCELEPREKRCPRAARAAQRFRILQEVNNLRVLDRAARTERRLDAAERRTLVNHLMATKEAKFDQIRGWLKLPDSALFNLERGGRKKLDGHLPDAALSGKKCLGKRWAPFAENIKDRAVDILVEEDTTEEAVRRLVTECGFPEEDAKVAAAIHLPEGYMSFGRGAIAKLLPHLENGVMLMADDASNSALHAAGYLRPDQREVNQRRFLPPSPNVANPVVRQALVEVRKTVNAVLRELVYRHGHTLGKLHVELAREAKKSFAERSQLRIDQSQREKARENAAKWIEEFDASIKPTRATVNRYLLWREHDEFCPYCGAKIGPAQLFNGEADVDHILPRWRSLDDSMANKVVAHRRCNAEKGDRTPREWLEDSDPERYERAMRVAERLPYGKQRKFQQKDILLDDFVQRQLNDTAYISRCVSQYLRCLGAKVVCTRGDMTADVRYWWGMNSILQPDGSDRKNRDDHRHHAVDALVIALTDEKRLFALANARGENMPPPWEGFREAAEVAVLAINVSHRAQRRLHGALHKDMFYGATHKPQASGTTANDTPRPWAKDWTEENCTFVRRKPIESLTKTQDLKKVRDPTVRAILRWHLLAQGIDPDKSGAIPGDAFKGKNLPRMPSGVPIRRVRMVEHSSAMRPVSESRSYQCVEPGSNHHMVIYDLLDAQGKPILNADGEPKRDGFVVPMIDVAARITRLLREQENEEKKRITLVERELGPGKKFAMSLSINEMFLLKMPDGSHSPHRIQKLSEGSIILRPHTYAGKVSDYDKPPLIQRRTPNTLRGRKVTVDALGRVRSAHD
ncbi:MAG: type II CRISPR RNA-guided endonuclease Cas9 [Thermoguttaceae bacterium]|jgi:CRISPR-associated endonuclease Csn1